MIIAVIFSIIGYLSGSVLYSSLFLKLFNKYEKLEKSKDKNPGTANAYMCGGFWCGTMTLICELLKGFIPVFTYNFFFSDKNSDNLMLAAVLSAPVIGHIFPIFFKFEGGKGIAATFGVLLGLLPYWFPAAILALFFIFYSVILRITPHFHRTLITFLSSVIAMIFTVKITSVCIGFFVITIAVCFRLITSKEKKDKLKVGLLWMC